MKGETIMQPITGAFLANIRNIEKNIRAILSQDMPESYIDRPIGYEWCNATTYGGICRNHQDRDPFTGELHETALVRYSTRYDITPDIIAHEILHALLPFRTGHGRLFKQGARVLEKHGYHVTVYMTDEQMHTLRPKKAAKTPYRYALVMPSGYVVARYKTACRIVKDAARGGVIIKQTGEPVRVERICEYD